MDWMLLVLLVCFGLPLIAARCPTEDCYQQLERCADTRSCHTFWGTRMADQLGSPLACCQLHWVKSAYKLPRKCASGRCTEKRD